ncbi:MAG: amidohydrolase family protein [Nitrospirota bacterium]
MEKADYIICGDYVVTMDERLSVLRDGAVAVGGTTVLAVDARDAVMKKYDARHIVAGEGRVVMPGLVNTHTHAAMVYFRGLADDLPLKEWLEGHIWPAEGKWLSAGFVGDAVELACLEMLKAGITTYNDMYFFGDSAAQSTRRLGMRAVLGVGIVDFPTMTAATADEYLGNAARFIDAWKGDELITPCIAPHSAYACGPETLRRVKALADERDVLVTTHLSETAWEVGELQSRFGKRPAEHLDALGLLDERLLAAHCVWLDEQEIALLARKRVGVSHCIESNLKLASGFAPVPEMLRAGIPVTFGTDGAASNNTLDIFGELSVAAKVHKALAKDPTVLDAKTALLMATRWGAEALHLADRIGSIERGKRADLITLDLRKPHLTPLYDIYSHLAYAAKASDVETVFVNGARVVSNGALQTGDEQELLRKAAAWAERIRACNSRS